MQGCFGMKLKKRIFYDFNYGWIDVFELDDWDMDYLYWENWC